MQDNNKLENSENINNRKNLVLSFYFRLLSIYELKYNRVVDFKDVCIYFFDTMPAHSIKMRALRKTIHKMPTFVNLLMLKTISVLSRRHGKFASLVIVELAASVGAKKNTSEEFEISDPAVKTNKTSVYSINTKTLKVSKKNKQKEKENYHPIVFKETHIPALIFLDPYLLNALSIISIVINTDHAHGCNYGWYKRNDIESFERRFSNRFILQDLNSHSTLSRYLLAPKKERKPGKTVWIGVAATPRGLTELIGGIEPSKNDFEWLTKVYNQLGEKIDLILPHPNSALEGFIKISQLHGIPLKQFDIRKVNIKDKFIFHSINCSLIYYCIKFELDFLIYSPRLLGDQYTQHFKSFMTKLEQDGKIKYL